MSNKPKPLAMRLLALSALLISACQTTAYAQPVPARLVSADIDAKNMLKAVLSETLARKNIVFGATDWDSSTISVLPARGQRPASAPFHQHDFALPKLFDLMIDKDGCYLVARDDPAKIPLKNIACQKL